MHNSRGAARFRLGWTLIIIGCLNAAFWVGLRWSFENKHRSVQLTVDYDETRLLADAYRVPHAQLLTELNKRGVTSVAVQEQTLSRLRDNGRLSVVTRDEAERLFPLVRWSDYPPAYRNFITTTAANADLLEQIFKHLQMQAQETLPPQRIALPGGTGGILIPASQQLITDAQMGFDPAQLRAIKNIAHGGIILTVRISNALNLDINRIRALLDEARDAGAHVVILSEDEVLGYSTMVPLVAREMRSRGLLFGTVEFAKQKGNDGLASGTDGLLVRVHSVSGEEAAKAKPEILEDRYVRAVKERNIRVAYIRLIRQFKGELAMKEGQDPEQKKTALEQNLQFIQQISTELRQAPLPIHSLRPGLVMGPAQAFGNYPLAQLSGLTGGERNARLARYIGQFLSGLGALGGALLLLNLFFDLKPRTEIGLLVLGIVIVGVLAISASTGARFLAFGAGCVFSTIGILWGGLPRLWDKVSQAPAPTDGRARAISAGKCFLVGCAVLVQTTLLTLLGPLLIMAILNHWKFLSDTLLFFGPKATQLLPLILVSLAFAGEVFPHRVAAEGAAAGQFRIRQWGKKVLDTPFTTRFALTAVVLLAAGAIWIMRTGNDSGLEVSDLEMKMRAVLEQVFLVRPRTKEIFVGHPAMIFATYFIARRRWPLAFGAIILATIGQSDLLNTFCHIHIPVFYSVWRTIMGLLIGIAVGAVALWAYSLLETRYSNRLFSNYGSGRRLEPDIDATPANGHAGSSSQIFEPVSSERP